MNLQRTSLLTAAPILLLGLSVASCAVATRTEASSAPSGPSGPTSTSDTPAGSPPGAAGPARYVGANVGWVSDWSVDNMWADILRQGRAWGGAVSRDTPIAVDAAGWPTQDTTIGFSVGSYGAYGIAGAGYKLSFTGQATVSGPNLTVTNVVYDAASNTTTADVQVKANSSTWITFTGTRRNPSDAPGNGITNVHLMRPGHSLSADVFNKQWVAAIGAAPFSLIRLVNPLGRDGVMSNKDSTWATRQAKPGAAAQAPTGISWEDAVLLANQVGVDVWINIPYHVDNDYITKVAQVFKYGSDGVTFLPFTGPFGSTPDPVSNPRPATHDPTTWTPGTSSWYPPLAATRRVYVEFVNELWNTAAAYPNTAENQADAKNEVNNLGDPKHLRYDGRADYWDVRRTAWNVARISILFRQVFGDADMMTRVRPVLAGQAANPLVLRRGLEYLATVFGLASRYDVVDGIPNPRQPIRHYVHAIAIAPYVRWSGPATVDAAFTQLASSVSQAKVAIDVHDALADQFNVKLAAYEGSTEVYQNDAFVKSVWADPRMTALLSDYLHYFYAKPTADVFNHYTMVSSGTDANGSFGLSYDILTTNTPRWQAFKDVAQGR